MRLIGYVIVNQVNNTLYAGHRHPGTQKVGTAVFVDNLENATFDGGKAAIWGEDKYSEAADIARMLGEEGHSCLVRPVYVQL